MLSAMHHSSSSWCRPVYYLGEFVRSTLHGLGEVVVSGRDPVVTFMSGVRLCVDGSTLVVVPDEVYEAEEHNRAQIEAWLTRRLTGQVVREPARLPRARTGLEEKMRQSRVEIPEAEYSKSAPAKICVSSLTVWKSPSWP